MNTDHLLSISPLDGRYSSQLDELRGCFSEYGYIVYRLKTEILWFENMVNGEEIKLKINTTILTCIIEFMDS